ncbi:Ig-like domain-containing protein [Listeria fleischmannii]|nr:Ig-like domain-containing protein [Listeria fleischmannii]EMG29327.1 modifier protein of major autolysin LytC [Listeria fleischmannii subsp. fleischmannii LU2006-1]
MKKTTASVLSAGIIASTIVVGAVPFNVQAAPNLTSSVQSQEFMKDQSFTQFGQNVNTGWAYFSSGGIQNLTAFNNEYKINADRPERIGYVSTGSFNGSSVLNLKAQALMENNYIQGLSSAQQKVTGLTPGQTYKFSVDYRVAETEFTDETNDSNFFSFSLKSGTGSTSGSSSNLQVTLKDYTWKTFTSTFVATSSDETITLNLGPYNKYAVSNGLFTTGQFRNPSLQNSDVTPPSKPNVNDIFTNSTQVTGKTEANATINIYRGGTLIGTGKADASGNYTAAIPAQAYGTVLQVAAKDVAGNEGEATSVTVKQAKPATPTINALTLNSTAVSGTAVANSDVTIRVTSASGNVKTYVTKATASGTYSSPVSAFANKDKVEVTSSLNGISSDAASQVVEDTTKPAAPTVNPVTTASEKVQGKALPNATVQAEMGGQTYTVKADASGNYTINIPKQAAGTSISVIQTSPVNGLVSNPTTVQVTADSTKLGAPTVNDYYVNSGYVTGKAPAGAKTIVASVGGKDIRSATVNADGTFKVYVNDSAQMGQVGTQFQVYAKDANGVAGDTALSTVKQKSNPLTTAPTINDYYVDGGYVTGKAPAGASTVTLSVNGQPLRTVAVAADGTYKVYVNDNGSMKQSGTPFQVVAKDASGNVSPQAASTVKGMTLNAPKINAYYKGDAYVTGTTDKGTSKIGLYDKNGSLLRYGQVNTDGTYIIYAPDKAQMNVVGDNFMVKALNDAGAASPAAQSTILASKVTASVTAQPYQIGTNYVSGTYKGDAARVQLLVNGVVVKNGALNVSNGSYQVYAKDLVTATTQKVEVVTLDSNFKELARTNVVVTEPAKPTLTATIDPYKLGDGSITGTVTSGTASGAALYVNGQLARSASVSGNSISVWAQDKITAKTDKVQLYVYDQNWKPVIYDVPVQ